MMVEYEKRRGLLPGACAAGAILLLALLLAAGCVSPGTGGGSEVRETFNRTVSAAGVAALDLQGVDGSCELRRSAEPQISLQATKRSRFGQAELDRVSIAVTEGSTLTVRTVHPNPPARVTVDYVILVPASLGAVQVATSNGAVLADGIPAQVSAQTSNGAVRILNAGGNVTVGTSNGAVEVLGANGTVTARTSNGAVTVENASVLGDLETSNGRLAAQVRAVGNDVTFRTSNGNIDLGLAPGLNAVIDAETSSGRVVLPTGMLRVSEQSATRVRGTAGAGGGTITVRTSNGDIGFTAIS